MKMRNFVNHALAAAQLLQICRLKRRLYCVSVFCRLWRLHARPSGSPKCLRDCASLGVMSAAHHAAEHRALAAAQARCRRSCARRSRRRARRPNLDTVLDLSWERLRRCYEQPELKLAASISPTAGMQWLGTDAGESAEG